MQNNTCLLYHIRLTYSHVPLLSPNSELLSLAATTTTTTMSIAFVFDDSDVSDVSDCSDDSQRTLIHGPRARRPPPITHQELFSRTELTADYSLGQPIYVPVGKWAWAAGKTIHSEGRVRHLDGPYLLPVSPRVPTQGCL